MAPAIYVAGLPPLRNLSADCPVTIVHGLKDTTVPCDDSVRYARETGASLHLVNDDHRLHHQLPLMKFLFEFFLIQLDLPRMRG
jgi:pimeloyl-ACP methyl ester carboxylesterase